MKNKLKIIIMIIIIIMTFNITACGGIDIASILTPEPTPEPVTEPTPALTPEPTPKSTPEVTPEPELTPELTPEPTPEPESISRKFPFSFTSIDLQGNTVTEEDLGEKELYFAYLWAVW